MSFSTACRTVLASALLLGIATHTLAAGPLQLQVYKLGDEAMGPVSSVIVTGPFEAVLSAKVVQGEMPWPS